MASVLCACVTVLAAAPGRPQRRGVACGASPSGPGGSKQPPPSRGPGAAPLRMQTDDQRKFGYGGDGYDGGSGRGGDDGGRWEPGNNDDGVNPVGLAILGVVGLWAYWEWKRPGGRLNPRTRYA